MSKIPLTPEPLTHERLTELEQRGLISTLSPPDSIANTPYQDGDKALYTSDRKFGSHMLLCVRKNEVDITLYAHSDNEEVIFLNPRSNSSKPLFLIIGMYKEAEFVERAKAGSLTSSDVLALEVNFNDPGTCLFTVLAGTPLCEITLPGESAEAPIFYVTESSDLDMYAVEVGEYQFCLA
jgi:hypothetical protein